MEWHDSESDIPDWPEVGSQIEMIMEDGAIVVGKIEGDTIDDELVFSIIDFDGQEWSFFDSVKWRVVD